MFNTAKELFDRYWNKIRQSVAERVAPTPDQWMETIGNVCDGITASQHLSVPKEKLERFTCILEPIGIGGCAHLRQGPIWIRGTRVSFDYCFARLFFNRSESLVSFLKASEQHLFRRAQTRQVLVYLRDRDFSRYVKELSDLLTDEGIRTHIKDLAFALLAEVRDLERTSGLSGKSG